MNDLKTISAVVRNILEEHKQTRNSDSLLYLKVLEHYSYAHGIELRMLSVPMFLTEMSSMGFPGFETVRRSRQKIQQHHPELCPCEAVECARMEREQEYRSFARGEA